MKAKAYRVPLLKIIKRLVSPKVKNQVDGFYLLTMSY